MWHSQSTEQALPSPYCSTQPCNGCVSSGHTVMAIFRLLFFRQYSFNVDRKIMGQQFYSLRRLPCIESDLKQFSWHATVSRERNIPPSSACGSLLCQDGIPELAFLHRFAIFQERCHARWYRWEVTGQKIHHTSRPQQAEADFLITGWRSVQRVHNRTLKSMFRIIIGRIGMINSFKDVLSFNILEQLIVIKSIKNSFKICRVLKFIPLICCRSKIGDKWRTAIMALRS